MLSYTIVSEEARKPIKDYCKQRKYKCKGCRYSIKWIAPGTKPNVTCIFADCPCDWLV